MRVADMTDTTLLPSDLDELSVAQLAALPPPLKAQIAHHLDAATDWLQHARAKFDASLEHAYGERIRTARSDAGNAFGVVHIDDGEVRLSVDQSACVVWDQTQLARIAARIAAAGEHVDTFIDVAYSIPESRFHQWPSALRAQFESARIVTPSAPSFRLTSVEEV
jgi:hypothetical protein